MLKKNTSTSVYANFANVSQLGMLLKIQLTRHSQHHSSPCHICTCSKQFPEKYNLEAHINTHDLEKFFDCIYPKCTRRYKSKVEYNWHVKTHNYIWTNTSKYIQMICHRSVLIVTNDTSGGQV